MKVPIIKQVSPALPLDTLRNALANHHLPCIVSPVGRDGVKVTPGRGIPRPAVEAFLAGFLAGFDA